MLRPNLPAINDKEDVAVPEGLPLVVDAHVQCFDMNAKEMDIVYNLCESDAIYLLFG